MTPMLLELRSARKAGRRSSDLMSLLIYFGPEMPDAYRAHAEALPRGCSPEHEPHARYAIGGAGHQLDQCVSGY